MEGVRRRDAFARRDLDRVGLEGRRAVGPGVLDRRVEEGCRDALPAGVARDDEADDRPDRDVVERGEDLRGGEALVVLARREADPADGAVVPVGDEARSELSLGERLQLGAIAGSRRIRPVATTEPKIGAPAPLRVAAFLEQRGEVGEATGVSGWTSMATGSDIVGRCYPSGPRETREAVAASTG